MAKEESKPDRKQYYEYLYQIASEIYEFLERKDNSVSHIKGGDLFTLMFEKTVSPFVYWKPEPEEKVSVGDASRLNALIKKFNLIQEEGRFKLSHPLDYEEFSRLSLNMKEIGFKYDSGTKSFSKGVKQ